MRAHSATIEELQGKLNILRQRDLELKKESQKYQSLIDETKREINTIKDEIIQLTYRINSLERELDLTKNKIELVGLEIEKLSLEIQKILDEIKITQGETAQTLSKLYQAERVSPVELVLSGDDFTDFWEQQQYFASFQSSLNALLTQMKALSVELSSKKQEQEQNKVQLERLQKQKEIQQNFLDNERQYQKVVLTQNEAQQRQYQSGLAQTEKSRRAIIEEILKTEEEVKRLRNFELYIKSGKIPSAGTKLFSWPGSSTGVTQGYGATAFARSGVAGYRFHNGIDIGGAIGSNVFAALQGKVVGKNTRACSNYGRLRDFGCQGGWGNWIALEHPNGLVTLYAHLVEPSSVPLGTSVNTGELLGYVGSSGNVTGPHLHFSLYTEFFLVPQGYPGYNPEGTLNPLLYL